ncbi:MAG TPA: hypothetical protein VMW68_06015 [Methyloceanibacter sp.]|nr:hypothetical protein [Methyloceanibacter sp.]
MNELPDIELENSVEEENTGDGETIKPWDPGKTRITTKNFTIREIYNQITEAELDLAPDFVWRAGRRPRGLRIATPVTDCAFRRASPFPQGGEHCAQGGR